MYLVVLLFTSYIAFSSRDDAIEKERDHNTIKKRSSIIKIEKRII